MAGAIKGTHCKNVVPSTGFVLWIWWPFLTHSLTLFLVSPLISRCGFKIVEPNGVSERIRKKVSWMECASGLLWMCPQSVLHSSLHQLTDSMIIFLLLAQAQADQPTMLIPSRAVESPFHRTRWSNAKRTRRRKSCANSWNAKRNDCNNPSKSRASTRPLWWRPSSKRCAISGQSTSMPRSRSIWWAVNCTPY